MKTDPDRTVYVGIPMRHAWSVVALAALLLPTEARAKCAMTGLAPVVLTPDGATIAPEGGIVVGARPEQDASLDDKDAAAQPGWRLRIGARAEQPTLVSLAPGLALYKLPSRATQASLIDDKRATVGKVTVGARTPALGAPKIKRIVHDTRLGRRPFATVQLQLATPVPAGAVAIVIADAKGVVRSWGEAKPGETSVFGYERRRCQVLPNDTVESKPGDKLVAYWIDAGGRKGAQTTGTVVGSKRDPDDD